MELEKRVCSLELAHKLEKLGVEQHSMFFWNLYNKSIMFGSPVGVNYRSAFTVGELGEMLPDKIINNGDEFEFVGFRDLHDWIISYRKLHIHSFLNIIRSNTEANARTKMLIWLIENKHIKI